MSDQEQPADGNQDEQLGMSGEYNAEDLKKLSDKEHVRERPSMYIGDTTLKGLHHLVYEVVDNSIDEVMAGFAKIVTVRINSDGQLELLSWTMISDVRTVDWHGNRDDG